MDHILDEFSHIREKLHTKSVKKVAGMPHTAGFCTIFLIAVRGLNVYLHMFILKNKSSTEPAG
jgi:hypothetical protein